MFSFRKEKKETSPDGQMELVEHLAELRTRIFRCLAYIAVAMAATYYLVPYIQGFLTRPMQPVLAQLPDSKLVLPGIADAFLLWMQVCFISGLALALPLVVLELWGFIVPALTEEERKPVKYLAPFSFLLFFAGLGTAYVCLPATFAWMSSYVGDFGSQLAIYQDIRVYILLTVKIMLAFGLAFQLPLILLFLARVGIITPAWMVKYWRHATVAISAFAAILTPSNDPLTMLMMAVPMAGLYILSISLVKAFQPREDGSRTPTMRTMLAVALAPVSILVAVGFWLARHTEMSPVKPTGGIIAATPAATPPPASSPDVLEAIRQELQTLKQGNQALSQENQELRRRIEALETNQKPR
jgi:sec-independent protein translocase protein TatC